MVSTSIQTASAGLAFSGMKDLGFAHGFDLQFSVKDPALNVFLCVGKEDNRVKVNGTNPRSRQHAVLAAIDGLGKWGQPISLWMAAEKAGVSAGRTPPVNYLAHVKPYRGNLTISDISAQSPRLTYAGNGKGRLLSAPVKGSRYFVHGGKLEADPNSRGFDCTTFPMALLEIQRLPAPGYGKQLCDALGATQCRIEQIDSTEMSRRFRENTIPEGVYVLFSAAHVLLYDSSRNVLHEFTHGGFKSTPAGQRTLQAPQNLWWMRKLPESYRSAFK